MSKAVIHITGQIGHTFNADGSIAQEGVTLQSVATQIQAQQDATEFEVRIDSPGGNVSLGFELAKMVKALPNASTVAVNQCASIATAIFCAVPQANRFIEAGCAFGIHNPLFANISGDAATLKAAADQLEPIQKELLANYVAATGAPKQVLQSMMNVETVLTAEEAVTMGFAGSVIEKQLQAVAFLDTQNATQVNTETMDKKTKSFLQRIGLVAANMNATTTAADPAADPNAGRNAVALMLETDQGVINTPYDDIMVGDPVTLEDGSVAPDGTYVVTDGMQIVVAGGVVSELIPVEGGDLQAMVVALQNEVAALKAENAELSAGIETANTVIASLEAKATRSTYKPNSSAVAVFPGQRQQPAAQGISKETLKERRNEYKQKNS